MSEESIKNRNESYLDLVNSYGLGEQEEAVFRTIFHHPHSTDKEISELSGIDKSSVNGRRNKLVEKGLVIESKGKYDTGSDRNVTTWKVKLDGEKIEKEKKSFLTNAEMNKATRLMIKLKSTANKFQRKKLDEVWNNED